jgi:hypothetical protein
VFARRDGRKDRERAAEDHLRTIAQRLSGLIVVGGDSARQEGLRTEKSDEQTLEGPALTAVANATTAPTPDVPLAVPAPPELAIGATAMPPTEERFHGGGVQRTIAWTLGAAGVVQLGAAGYFGLRAFGKHADSNAECPDDHCTSLGVELNGASRRAADASTVLAITGIGTMATGVYLLLTSPKASDGRSSARTPARWAITSTGTTFGLQRRF